MNRSKILKDLQERLPMRIDKSARQIISKASAQISLSAIANERENFRNLFKQTPEMVCIMIGPEHVFEFVNEAHVKVLGFNATGKSVREAQPESVEVHGILDRVYETGVTAELHEIPVTVGDRLRYFNLTYAARRSTDNKISGVMILGTEITDEFRNREILKSQNRAFEMTMAGAPLIDVLDVLVHAIEAHIGFGAVASIHLLDSEGKSLSMGPAPDAARDELKPHWSQFIRSSRGKVIGTFSLHNLPEKPLSSRDQEVLRLITQTVAIIIERHIEAKERHNAETALRKSETLYRVSEEQLGQAIDVARVGFYDWNIAENKMTFSPQMLSDWGVTEPLHTLEEALVYIHPDDIERVLGLVDSAINEGSTYHTEYRVRQPDGSYEWMDVRGQVHHDKQGKPMRFFGTCVVKTEQKNIETDLRQAREDAEKASAAKGIFLANMSHEIRTPLGAIMGFLDLLKNPSTSQENLMEYIGIIDRNSKQLLRIVDDVLDLSKIEAGKFLIESIQFSLIELLADFTSLMSFKAKEKGLTYNLKLETELPDIIEGDPTRIRQILSNVVGNAIKFTERGDINFRVAFESGLLKIFVEDTGCGIDTEQMSQLFQPFSQADSSTTRLYGGTGLGLSLTKRLSEALGGSFFLEDSAIGAGSTFVVTLPLKTLAKTKMISTSDLNPDLKADEPTSSKSHFLQDVKILVVDDSPDNRALMKIVLQKWGAKVEVAINGLDGVKRATASDYDTILMDVQMPMMDGHEATKRLRALGLTKPIVALTAHAMKEEREHCIQSGFSNFLSKPIDKDAILNLLLELNSDKVSLK